MCRSEDIFVESASPSTFGGSRDQSPFPGLHTKHRLSPLPGPLLTFAWLWGLMLHGEQLPTGQASCLGRFLLGMDSVGGMSIICTYIGVTFLPSLLCLTPSSLLGLPALQSSPFCTDPVSKGTPSPLCVGIIGAQPSLWALWAVAGRLTPLKARKPAGDMDSEVLPHK